MHRVRKKNHEHKQLRRPNNNNAEKVKKKLPTSHPHIYMLHKFSCKAPIVNTFLQHKFLIIRLFHKVTMVIDINNHHCLTREHNVCM